VAGASNLWAMRKPIAPLRCVKFFASGEHFKKSLDCRLSEW
jgi:hypothetical protein